MPFSVPPAVPRTPPQGHYSADLFPPFIKYISVAIRSSPRKGPRLCWQSQCQSRIRPYQGWVSPQGVPWGACTLLPPPPAPADHRVATTTRTPAFRKQESVSMGADKMPHQGHHPSQGLPVSPSFPVPTPVCPPDSCSPVAPATPSSPAAVSTGSVLGPGQAGGGGQAGAQELQARRGRRGGTGDLGGTEPRGVQLDPGGLPGRHQPCFGQGLIQRLIRVWEGCTDAQRGGPLV